jgi:hypothetical protein
VAQKATAIAEKARGESRRSADAATFLWKALRHARMIAWRTVYGTRA